MRFFGYPPRSRFFGYPPRSRFFGCPPRSRFFLVSTAVVDFLVSTAVVAFWVSTAVAVYWKPTAVAPAVANLVCKKTLHLTRQRPYKFVCKKTLHDRSGAVVAPQWQPLRYAVADNRSRCHCGRVKFCFGPSTLIKNHILVIGGSPHSPPQFLLFFLFI